MRHLIFLSIAYLLLPTPAVAQRDSPVWESYLDRVSVYHLDKLSTNIELVWQKGGGPSKHAEHQIYLLAYLQKNESKVLELAKDPELMSKATKKKGEKKLLDVLLEKQLVTILDTRTSTRIKRDVNDADPKTARRTFAFPFAFKFANQALFDAVSKLPGFNAKSPVNSVGYTWFADEVKIIPFIPVNDCKYANKVSPGNKDAYDFAYPQDSVTVAQYYRPLPYIFQFKRIPNGEMLVYIH